jgi:hypothetical protein
MTLATGVGVADTVWCWPRGLSPREAGFLAPCVNLPSRVDGMGVGGLCPLTPCVFAGLFAANMEQRKWKVPLYRFLYTLLTTLWLLFIRTFLVRRHR